MVRSYSDIKGSFGWMEERKRTDRETERQRDRREVKRRERGQTGRRTKKKEKGRVVSCTTYASMRHAYESIYGRKRKRDWVISERLSTGLEVSPKVAQHGHQSPKCTHASRQ